MFIMKPDPTRLHSIEHDHCRQHVVLESWAPCSLEISWKVQDVQYLTCSVCLHRRLTFGCLHVAEGQALKFFSYPLDPNAIFLSLSSDAHHLGLARLFRYISIVKMTGEDTIPPRTISTPLPAKENAPNAVSTIASRMVTTLPSHNDRNRVVSINDAQAAPTANVSLDPSHDCANCGNIAKQRCTGCIRDVNDQSNDGPPTTYYCSGDCQGDHWKTTHKTQCALAIDRRQLFRIGRLVQWVFYACTKAMWYVHIMQVVKTRDTEVIDGAQLELWRRKRHDRSDFPVFMDAKFNNIYDEKLEERDKQAVLATSARTGPIVRRFLNELVKGELCLVLLCDLY
jgi:hypothetical protein